MLHIVGLPHSDICGSILICSSPQLFAACHVLLRLPMPRHSPCTLYSLNFVRNANLSLKNGFLAFLNCSNFTQRQSQINLFLSFCFFTFSICFLFSILFYSVFKVHLVGSSGLEPPTSRLSGECSSLLSYEPIQCSSQLVFPAMVEMKRFELLTPCLQGRCSPN